MASAYLIATFAEPHALVEAVATIRAHGFKIYDVYAPCPVHGLDEAMGIRRSRLPYVTLAAGVVALAGTLAFEFYVAVFKISEDLTVLRADFEAERRRAAGPAE